MRADQHLTRGRLLTVLLFIVSSGYCTMASSDLGSFGERAATVVAEDLKQRQLLQSKATAGTQSNNGPTSLASGYGTRPPAWNGRFDPVYGRSYFAPAITQNHCQASNPKHCNAIAAYPNLTYPYERYIMDPTNLTDSGPVMQIWYPKGGWAASSEHPSGTLFYAFPFKSNPNDPGNPVSRDTATFEYEVYFPANFDFVSGGKLPGFASARGCAVAVDPNSCFSARIMWHTDGVVQILLVVPPYQDPTLKTFYHACHGTNYPCTFYSGRTGYAFGRGAFQFQLGAWNKITMTIGLNTPNQTNGLLEVRYNDQVGIRFTKMNWRVTPDVVLDGLEISSWFGGSDVTWAPPKDQYSLLRNFRLWRNDPPTTGAARSGIRHSTVGQVVITENLQD